MQKLQHILILAAFWGVTLGISQQWQYKSPMSIARKGMAVAVLEEKIWIIGGSQMGNGGLDEVEVYDPSTDSWNNNYPALQFARADAVAQTISGKIYVFGGSNQSVLVTEVERYDPAIGSWQVISQIPTPRRGLTSVLVDSAIWLIGGSNLQNIFYDLIEIYHPQTNSWDTLNARLNYARSEAMAAVSPFGIFVFGGNFFGPISMVERYNRLSQQWENVGSMLYNCGSAGYATHDNRCWIIGGIGLIGTPLDRVQIFYRNDSLQLGWQEGPPLNTPRRELVAAAVNNKLYAIGGRGTMGHSFYNIVEELDLLVNIFKPEDIVPNDYLTLNNYPNPFNSITTIQCFLPQKDEIVLVLRNVLGQKLLTIYQGTLATGPHTFNLSSNYLTGNEKASGLYFLQLEGNKFSKIHKIFLLK